jgi:DNA-binding Lrp family transcriptional regulator
MDERDCRLLIELMRTPFDSYQSIGRKVGFNGKVTRKRIDRLRTVGVLQGLACGPSPGALGMRSVLAVYLENPIKCDTRDLLALPGVVWAAEVYPPAWTPLFYLREGEDLPKDLMVYAGRPPDRVLNITPSPRTRARELSPLDWRVMRAVMAEPRATVVELSVRCKLTPRTVKTRRDRMLRDGDLFAFPAIDSAQEEGTILYGAYVRSAEVPDLNGVHLPNSWRLNSHQDPPAVFLYGYVKNYAEAKGTERQLQSIPGVQEVYFTIPQGTYCANRRLESWVDERIEFWGRMKRGARPVQ